MPRFGKVTIAAQEIGSIQPSGTMPSDKQDANEALEDLTPAAIRTLAEVHDSFLQFARRSLRNDSDAEEVMQQFYLRVIVHASQLLNEESVLMWLRRVLQSALSDYRRREAARGRAEADFARKDAAISPPSIEDLEAFVCLCLYKLLPLLRPEYAEVLRRVDLENEPREATAIALGLTPGNLAVRLHRARQAVPRAQQLTCQTCPIHGYLDCGCDYTKRLRSGHLPSA
jgi:RNA polymerase sigma-70 factor (ECF subfamily)